MIKRCGYVERFDTIEEIKECAKYYVELLGLQDWKIRYKLDVPSNEDWAGECEHYDVEKCAFITIDNRKHDDLWFRQAQEKDLLHELLHCKIPLPTTDHWEDLIVEQFYHQLVDDMARAIFFARYKLTNKDLYFDEEKS